MHTDKSITISKTIAFEDEVCNSKFKIEKSSHIEIALKVLSGEMTANDGLYELCSNEGMNDKWFANNFELGKFLFTLVPQSGNKKTKYIDDDMKANLMKEVGIEKNVRRFNFSL